MDDVIIIGLPIYAFLLTTMCWRAIARSKQQPNIVNILCAVGSVLFVFSDACIAIDKFYTTISNSRVCIYLNVHCHYLNFFSTMRKITFSTFFFFSYRFT